MATERRGGKENGGEQPWQARERRNDLGRIGELRQSSWADERGRLHAPDTGAIQAVDDRNLGFGRNLRGDRLEAVTRPDLDDLKSLQGRVHRMPSFSKPEISSG